MKTTIKIEKEVEIKTLSAKAGVRYWEDSEINGVESDDDTGLLIPCREGDLGCPVIDIDTGIIQNWTKGVEAIVHYKVCDDGSYYLHDADGEVLLSIEGDYVPNIMCPEGEGYGDYIKMKILADGQICNWNPTLKGFVDEED